MCRVYLELCKDIRSFEVQLLKLSWKYPQIITQNEHSSTFNPEFYKNRFGKSKYEQSTTNWTKIVLYVSNWAINHHSFEIDNVLKTEIVRSIGYSEFNRWTNYQLKIVQGAFTPTSSLQGLIELLKHNFFYLVLVLL